MQLQSNNASQPVQATTKPRPNILAEGITKRGEKPLLLERLEALVAAHPQKYPKQCVKRVRRFVEVIENNPGIPRRCSKYLVSISEWKLYFELHDEWKGKQIHWFSRNQDAEARSFSHNLYRFIQRLPLAKERKKALYREFITRKWLDWSGYKTQGDWLAEFSRHKSWANKSISQLTKKPGSYSYKFISKFHEWVSKQPLDKEAKKKLRNSLPVKKTLSWLKIDFISLNSVDSWLAVARERGWFGKSPSQMQHSQGKAAKSFYGKYCSWVNANTTTEKERLQTVHRIFPRATNSWEHIQTVASVRRVLKTFSCFEGMTISQVSLDKNNNGHSVYRSISRWAQRKARSELGIPKKSKISGNLARKVKNRQKELIRTIFYGPYVSKKIV